MWNWQSFNGSAWSTLVDKALPDITADIAIQETRLRDMFSAAGESSFAQPLRQLRQRGWHADFAAAAATGNGAEVSGGVGIAWRAYVAVQPLGTWIPGRVVAISDTFPYLGDIVVISFYGDAHNKEDTQQMLEQLGDRLCRI
jgi:hypothetical protein